MAQTVRIGLIQHKCPTTTISDPAQNLNKSIEMIRDAAAQGAQIVATQELFTLPYFPQTEDDSHFALAETIPGPTSDRLCELARELNIDIIASIFEKRTQGIFHNTAVTIDHTGHIVGKYRKMHIPDDPCFYEKYYFTPGDSVDECWSFQQTRHVKTGVLICWDQWFPEAARLTALRGAQILFYPTAIAWLDGETEEDHQQQFDAWLTIQRAHAISNGVYVAAINRIGRENKLNFWGSSVVIDPLGVVLAQAPIDDEAILIADCDLSRIDAVRQAWPFLRDRRVDAYGDLTKRMIDSNPGT